MDFPILNINKWSQKIKCSLKYFYYPIKLGGSQRVLSQATEEYICIEFKLPVQIIHSIIHTKDKRWNCFKNMFSLFRFKTTYHCHSRQCCRHHASTTSDVFAASRLASAPFKRKSHSLYFYLMSTQKHLRHSKLHLGLNIML